MATILHIDRSKKWPKEYKEMPPKRTFLAAFSQIDQQARPRGKKSPKKRTYYVLSTNNEHKTSRKSTAFLDRNRFAKTRVIRYTERVRGAKKIALRATKKGLTRYIMTNMPFPLCTTPAVSGATIRLRILKALTY